MGSWAPARGVRRAASAAALAIALTALAAPAAGARPARDHHADGRISDWVGRPTMLAGRSQLSRGELIYTDYLYDDYGPNLDGTPNPTAFRCLFCPTSGDYRYPKDESRYGNNAADLRELRLAIDHRALHVLVALQTMKAKNASVAEIAIDRDGKRSTGAGHWPAGAGLTTLGADRFITLTATGARVYGATGRAHGVRHGANLKQNFMEADVPLRRLGKLGRHARVWVAVGLEAKGGGFLPETSGKTAAFDSGFQGAEQYGPLTDWGDQRQSGLLATGDISALGRRLPVRGMRRGATHRFRLVPGYYNRIFRSHYTYDEGISLKQNGSTSGTPDPMFRGRYQPYGLYVPKDYRPGHATPLLLDGHSLDTNQNEYAALGPNQFTQLGDDRSSLIITPLARGSDTWYLKSGLRDVFEAWRDVRRHYGADPNRTAITGYSMGGYMTYRLGLLMPDAFTRASVYVGPPAYYFWPYPGDLQSTPEWRVPGNTSLIADNGINLPFEVNHGNLDELVPIGGVVHQTDVLRAAGVPYRFYHHTNDDHGSFILKDQWPQTEAWLGGPSVRRDPNPVRVVYKRYPSMDVKGVPKFDGAYWVDGMVVRDAKQPTDFGEVDVTTQGQGRRPPTLVDEGTSLYTGPTGISPATVTGQHYKRGAKAPRRNAFSAKLTNLSSILLRPGRMGLNPRRLVKATLSGDGRTVLRFSGHWPEDLIATLDGKSVPARGGNAARVVVTLNGSDHHLVIGE
jgi:dienelactone hydrolase